MSTFIRFSIYLMAACIILFTALVGLYAMVQTYGFISTVATYAAFGIALKIIATIDAMPSITSKNRRI